MSHLYRLDGHTPVPVADAIEWAVWFEHANDARVVGRTVVGAVTVSTVFLGLDYAYGGGPPILFETATFGDPFQQHQRRYGTWAEAEAGHAAVVAEVAKALTRASN